ncbi:MAG: PEP-utilizing enzyme [Pseudonocardia sp.]
MVLDPADAHVEPAEILAAPTTDPGWTPLLLRAAGLVTETGSPMAHGPTVARKHHIPPSLRRDAADRHGELITIDGGRQDRHHRRPRGATASPGHDHQECGDSPRCERPATLLTIMPRARGRGPHRDPAAPWRDPPVRRPARCATRACRMGNSPIPEAQSPW